MSAKVHKTITIHQGRVFELTTEEITLANGTRVDIDVIRHPGASAIVPIDHDNHVILVKQYRHALGGFIWEIPAGTLNPGEEPIDCARRELAEETGFTPNRLEKLGEITPVPGYSNERIHLFLATGLMESEQNLDQDELLHVHRVRFQDAVEMVYRGDIRDAKTICGLMLTGYQRSSNSL
jgi:ADP-ribose pyrophosphatase